jgi:hypothetical protein
MPRLSLSSSHQGHQGIDLKLIKPPPKHVNDLDEGAKPVIQKMMFDQQQKRLGLPTSDELLIQVLPPCKLQSPSEPSLGNSHSSSRLQIFQASQRRGGRDYVVVHQAGDNPPEARRERRGRRIFGLFLKEKRKERERG